MKKSRINPISKKQKVEIAWRVKLKRELIEEHGEICMTCGYNPDWRGISLSHIIPLSRGGATTRENCILECYLCHSKRHGLREV